MHNTAEQSNSSCLLLDARNISLLIERIRNLPEECALWLKMGSPARLIPRYTSDGIETSDLVFVFDINTSPSKLGTIISAIPSGCIFTPDHNIPIAFLQVVCPVLSSGTFFRPASLTPIINIELVQQILPRGCQYLRVLDTPASKPHSFFSSPDLLTREASASSLSMKTCNSGDEDEQYPPAKRPKKLNFMGS